MTTVINTSNSEVTTPTSYVSRWIAQSHGKYQKKPDGYYSSSCDYRTLTTSIITIPTKSNSNSPITTWQAQAKSRSNASATTTNSDISAHDNNNNDLQEKLNRVR